MKVDKSREPDMENIFNRLSYLEGLVEQLELRLNRLENPVHPVYSPSPGYENKCSVCGIDFANSMGYVCDSTACPMSSKTGDVFFGINKGG